MRRRNGCSRRPLAQLAAAAVAVAVVVGGCSAQQRTGTDRAEVTATTEGSPGDGGSTGSGELVVPDVELHQPPAWRAGPGEVEPTVKELATGYVEALGTWDRRDGDSDPAAVAARVAAEHPPLAAAPTAAEGTAGAAGVTPAMTSSAALLGDSGAVAAAAGVVYPQYGGLTSTRASVMVITTQQLLDPFGATTTRQLALDVRLARGDDGWQVTGIADPLPVDPPRQPGDLARQVLADEAINLPGPARDDIATGLVDDAVLATLLGMATEHTLDVAVVRTGHPANVFETDRTSNHTRYRGVDLWRIDGHLLVDPATPDDLVDRALELAGSFGATEVGGPVDHNGPTPGWFTDQVHRDHIHIGVSPGRPPLRG